VNANRTAKFQDVFHDTIPDYASALSKTLRHLVHAASDSELEPFIYMARQAALWEKAFTKVPRNDPSQAFLEPLMCCMHSIGFLAQFLQDGGNITLDSCDMNEPGRLVFLE
jgi:hypothetical protein